MKKFRNKLLILLIIAMPTTAYGLTPSDHEGSKDKQPVTASAISRDFANTGIKLVTTHYRWNSPNKGAKVTPAPHKKTYAKPRTEYNVIHIDKTTHINKSKEEIQ